MVMIYAAMRSEVATRELMELALAEGKTLVYPRTDWETWRIVPALLKDPNVLRPGRFGVPEPTTTLAPVGPDSIDLALVPGVAFDIYGHRLGYGGGFFDRFLSALPDHAAAWGLAFDVQVMGRLPAEPHDVKVDVVVTETRWIVAEPHHG